MSENSLRCRILLHAADLPMVAPGSAGASGVDLRAAIDDVVTIEPGRWKMVPTGLVVAIPFGLEGQIRSRSGLAADQGIFVLNSPGTIDSDFRGELTVILANFSDRPFEVRRGDRIAQLVVARVEHFALAVVKELEDTDRGSRGFGSTGMK